MVRKYNVAAARPKVAGAIYRAPVGTALPTDATSALGSAFTGLGYVSRDGVQASGSTDREVTISWGGGKVLDMPTGREDTFKFTLIETKNADVRGAVRGSGNVETTPGGSVTRVRAEMPRFSWVIDMILSGNVLQRIVIPRGEVRKLGDVIYQDGELAAYEVTIRAMRTDGVYHREYLFDPDAPAVYRLSSWEAALAELYARDAAGSMTVPAMTGSAEFQQWMAANNITGAADFEAGKHVGAMDKIFSRARNTAGISAGDLPVSRVLRNGSGTETFDTDHGSPETLTAKVQVRSGVLTIAWTVAGIPAGTSRYTADLTDESPPRLSMYITGNTAYYGTWRVTMGTPQWDTTPAVCSLRPWIRVAGSGLEAMDVVPGGSCEFTSTPVSDKSVFYFEVCTHSTGDSVTFAGNGTYTMTIPYTVELISVVQVQTHETPSASLLTKLADQTGLFLLAEPGLKEFTARDGVKTWPVTLADAEQGQALDVFGGGVMAMSSPATRTEPDLYAYSLLLSGNVEPREIDNDGQPMTIRSVQAVYGQVSATYLYHDQVQFYAFDVESGDKGHSGGNAVTKDFDVYRRET